MPVPTYCDVFLDQMFHWKSDPIEEGVTCSSCLVHDVSHRKVPFMAEIGFPFQMEEVQIFKCWLLKWRSFNSQNVSRKDLRNQLKFYIDFDIAGQICPWNVSSPMKVFFNTFVDFVFKLLQLPLKILKLVVC